MAFPTNPSDGQIYQSYRYNSTKLSWEERIPRLLPIWRGYTNIASNPTVELYRLALTKDYEEDCSYDGTYVSIPVSGYYNINMAITFDSGDGSDDTIQLYFEQKDSSDVVTKHCYMNADPRVFTASGKEQISTLATVAKLNNGDTIAAVVDNIASNTPVRITRANFSGFLIREL